MVPGIFRNLWYNRLSLNYVLTSIYGYLKLSCIDPFYNPKALSHDPKNPFTTLIIDYRVRFHTINRHHYRNQY
jgi:hypothetical protein